MKNKGLKIFASVLIVLITIMATVLRCWNAEWGGFCLMGLGYIAFVLLIPILVAINFNIHWFLKSALLFSALAMLILQFASTGNNVALFLFALFVLVGLFLSISSFIVKAKHRKYLGTIIILGCLVLIISFFFAPVNLAHKILTEENIQLISSNSTDVVLSFDPPTRVLSPKKLTRINCRFEQDDGGYRTAFFNPEPGISRWNPYDDFFVQDLKGDEFYEKSSKRFNKVCCKGYGGGIDTICYDLK